jgi:hypothetical protein
MPQQLYKAPTDEHNKNRKICLNMPSPDGVEPQHRKAINRNQQIMQDVARRDVRTTLTTDPEEADLVLFYVSFNIGQKLDHSRSCIRGHSVRKRFIEKSFIYDDGFRALPFLPGVFTNVERRWFDAARQRQGHILITICTTIVSSRDPLSTRQTPCTLLWAHR